jgi:hypothetical protein
MARSSWIQGRDGNHFKPYSFKDVVYRIMYVESFHRSTVVVNGEFEWERPIGVEVWSIFTQQHV